jgi:hypothetical protein
MEPNRPHIAIIGSGPVGLEAALGALEGGFPFTLFEAHDAVAGHVRSWGHVRLFTPWSMNVSPRMRRHLERSGAAAPSGSDCPTGDELVQTLLQPLSEHADIAPRIRLGTRVVAIGREGLLKHEEIATPARASAGFRLLLSTEDGGEQVARADVVLDCTGTYGNPNCTGDGGIPAPGERSLGDAVVRAIPDFAGDAAEWAGKRTLLVGAGHSAQTAAAALAELARDAPGTRVLWAIRRSDPLGNAIASDPLPERARLAESTRALAAGQSPAVELRAGVVVEALYPGGALLRALTDDGGSRAGAAGGGRADGGAVEQGTVQQGTVGRDNVEPGAVEPGAVERGVVEPVEIDRVLSLTGSVGDHTLYRQLQVHECYATSGPMKLSAALLGESSVDCLDQGSHGPDTLRNPEPGFFILGAKSYGRNNTFLMKQGWQQVDDVLGMLQ